MPGDHSLQCFSSDCQRTLTKVTPVRGNEYPTYLNQSPSQNFEELVLLELQNLTKIRKLTPLENLEEGKNSHAAAPRQNSVTNNILNY